MKKTLLMGCLVSSVLSVAATTGSVNFTNETDTKVTNLTKSGIKSGIKSTDLKDKLEAKLAIGKNFELGAMISNKTAFDALKVNKETLMAKDEEPTLWFKVGDKNFFKASIRPTKTDSARKFDASVELKPINITDSYINPNNGSGKIKDNISEDVLNNAYDNLVKLTKLGVFPKLFENENLYNEKNDKDTVSKNLIKFLENKTDTTYHPAYIYEKDAVYTFRPELQLHLEKSLDDLTFAGDAKSSFNITKDVKKPVLDLKVFVNKGDLDGVKDANAYVALNFKDLNKFNSTKEYKTKFGPRVLEGGLSGSYDLNDKTKIDVSAAAKYTFSIFDDNSDVDSLRKRFEDKKSQVANGLKLYSHKPNGLSEMSSAFHLGFNKVWKGKNDARFAKIMEVMVENSSNITTSNSEDYKKAISPYAGKSHELVLLQKFISNLNKVNDKGGDVTAALSSRQTGENLLRIYNDKDELLQLWLGLVKPVFANPNADYGLVPEMLNYDLKLGKFNEKYFLNINHVFGKELSLSGKVGVQHAYFFDNTNYTEHVIAPTLEAKLNASTNNFNFDTDLKLGYAIVLANKSNKYELGINGMAKASYDYMPTDKITLTPSVTGEFLYANRNDGKVLRIGQKDNNPESADEVKEETQDKTVSAKASVTPAVDFKYASEKGIKVGLGISAPFNFDNSSYSISDFFKENLEKGDLRLSDYDTQAKSRGVRFANMDFKTTLSLGYEW